nr:4201_t:CDS:1 [Entrophospora candida]
MYGNNNNQNLVNLNSLLFFDGQTSSFHVPQTRGDNDFDYQNVQQNLFHSNSIFQTPEDNNISAYQNDGDNNHFHFNLVHDNFVNENSGDDNFIHQNNFVGQNPLTSTDIASNNGFVKDNTFDGSTNIINNNNGLADQNTAIPTDIINNLSEQNSFNATNAMMMRIDHPNNSFVQNNFIDQHHNRDQQLNYIIFLLHQLLNNNNKN